jgi:chromosome segregation protein
MAAVALLLAIFRARPSPFCILDEVDAALDESNVDRFTALVREFLDQSQFVVITHNKRTMSIADVLYGVTMGEPGVSRKVSVKFSDMHERGYIATDDKQPRGGREHVAPPPVVAPETAAALAALGHGRVAAPAAAPVEPALAPAVEPAAEAAGDAQSSPAQSVAPAVAETAERG